MPFSARKLLFQGLRSLLLGTAVIGFGVCLVLICLVWALRPAGLAWLKVNLAWAQNTLEVTAQGVEIADQALQSAEDSVAALSETLRATAGVVKDSRPLLGTLTTVTGQDLPETVRATQRSLASAQESARFMDSALATLDSLPFIGNLYNAPQPLHEAIGEISTSLERMQPALSSMQRSLSGTEDRLETVQANLELITREVRDIQTSLKAAQEVLGRYRQQLAGLQGRVDRWEARLPRLVDGVCILMTLVLVWTAVGQVGLFLQGWRLKTDPIKTM